MQERVESVSLYKVFIYLLGLSGTCLGVALIIESKLGLDAWNAVMAGLDVQTSISLGLWSVIVQSSFWIIASILDKKMNLLCIFPILWKGLMLDVSKAFVSYLPLASGLGFNILLFFVGYIIVGMSTGVYVSTGYPKMPIDGLMVAISNFFSWKMKWARLLIEITGFIVMILVSGPFGIGTIIITFTIGYFISASKKISEKYILSI
ncbi:MAG: hypothetical protein RR561_01065 [Peptostreptococcus sp.]|uniref:hypothetical protein n=1 Tax=Peptostreptococcus sp. TaxID=1262 RepID=UPI002FC6AE49